MKLCLAQAGILEKRKSQSGYYGADSPFDSIRLGDQDVRVVTLSTPKEQAQGFQHHSEIPKDQAYLFPNLGGSMFHMYNVPQDLLMVAVGPDKEVLGKEIRKPNTPGKVIAGGKGKHILELHPLYDPYVQVGQRLGQVEKRKAQRQDYGWLKPDGTYIPVFTNHGDYLSKNTKFVSVWTAIENGWCRVTYVGGILYANANSINPKQKRELINLALESGKEKINLDNDGDTRTIWQREERESAKRDLRLHRPAQAIASALGKTFPHVDVRDHGHQISILAGTHRNTPWKLGDKGTIKTIPGGEDYSGVAIRVHNPEAPFVKVDEINVAPKDQGKGHAIKMLEGIQKGGIPVYHSFDLSNGFWPYIKQKRPDLFNRDDLKTGSLRQARRAPFGWITPESTFLPCNTNHLIYLKQNNLAGSYEEAMYKGYARVTFFHNDLYGSNYYIRIKPQQQDVLQKLASEGGYDRLIIDNGRSDTVVWQKGGT